jgi:hypothetical protein
MTTLETGDVGLDRYDASVATGASGTLARLQSSGDPRQRGRPHRAPLGTARRGRPVTPSPWGSPSPPGRRGSATCASTCGRSGRRPAGTSIWRPTSTRCRGPIPRRGSTHCVRARLIGEGNPLWLSGSNLYLNRLWLDERLVATELLARAEGDVMDVDLALLRSGLTTLFRETTRRARIPTTCNRWPRPPPFSSGSRSSREGRGREDHDRGPPVGVARPAGGRPRAAHLRSSPWPRRPGRRRLRLEEAVRDEATRLDFGRSGTAGAPPRAARHDAASAARACRRQPDPVPARRSNPLAPRRRRRRRDLHGLPVHDGPAPRGAPQLTRG